MFSTTCRHSDPAAPALHDGARWHSYRELEERVERLGETLPARRSLVFCFCRNNVPSIAWYLAAARAGHAVALLNGALHPDLKARLAAVYLPDVILSSEESDWGPEYAAAAAPAGNYQWTRLRPSELPLHPELALLLSTSGTTGSPKFVRLTARNVAANAESIREALSIGSGDRAVSSLPFHYSYGLSVLNTHLLAGASIALTEDGLLTPAFWATVRDRQCTSLAGVPYTYQILNRLNFDELNVPSLTTMTQAGGKLNDELIRKFHLLMTARGGRFFVMYGQTEATARIAILPSNRLPEKAGSAGQAIPGGALTVDAPKGEAGELVYTGPNVMMGYANQREDLSLGDELLGRLRTGDVARLDPEGYVYIHGRMKREAKLFGLRINLDEVETMLRPHGPTAVLAQEDGLLICCEYGDEEAYRRHSQELSAKLNVAFRAFRFQRVEALPVTGNGKIDYQALEALAR